MLNGMCVGLQSQRRSTQRSGVAGCRDRILNHKFKLTNLSRQVKELKDQHADGIRKVREQVFKEPVLQ
jgi:hypothetical protein